MHNTRAENLIMLIIVINALIFQTINSLSVWLKLITYEIIHPQDTALAFCLALGYKGLIVIVIVIVIYLL